jgi:hypothetical protein
MSFIAVITFLGDAYVNSPGGEPSWGNTRRHFLMFLSGRALKTARRGRLIVDSAIAERVSDPFAGDDRAEDEADTAKRR